MRILAALVALATLAAAGAMMEHMDHSSTDQPWSFFVFRSLWPGTVLAGTAAPSTQVMNFTIHGLWPNFSNGSSPYFCGDEAFAPGQLGSELLGDMAILWGCFWPDCAPPSGQGNLGFWNHEWTKHGTCAIQDSAVMPTQKEFFSSVLRLKRATPLLQILAAVGIVPSNSVTYSALEITNALAGFGYAGLLFCQPPPTTSYGPNVPQLLSIELCFDRELNHMECDTAVQSNALQFGECNEDAIWIPPITYASAT